jgi:rhodanese-related sulfurtransferase
VTSRPRLRIPRALREAVLLILIAAVPATVTGFLQLRPTEKKPLAPGEILAADGRELGEKAVWVDARARKKFEQGSVPGAVLLNEEEWDAQVPKFLDAWDPEKTIIVFGERGSDAGEGIAHRLREELKIENVRVLHGGYEEWIRP